MTHFTPEQIRAGKKLVEYFLCKKIQREEARQRALELLCEHAPEKIMRALSDSSVALKIENLYQKLNYKTLRHLNK